MEYKEVARVMNVGNQTTMNINYCVESAYLCGNANEGHNYPVETVLYRKHHDSLDGVIDACDDFLHVVYNDEPYTSDPFPFYFYRIAKEQQIDSDGIFICTEYREVVFYSHDGDLIMVANIKKEITVEP